MISGLSCLKQLIFFIMKFFAALIRLEILLGEEASLSSEVEHSHELHEQ